MNHYMHMRLTSSYSSKADYAMSSFISVLIAKLFKYVLATVMVLLQNSVSYSIKGLNVCCLKMTLYSAYYENNIELHS